MILYCSTQIYKKDWRLSMKISYHENKKELGIVYDFNKINAEFKKLGVPSDVWTPCNVPFNSAKWIIEMSERTVGKTTNVLLYGLVMHKLYGTHIEYVRETEIMLAPKYTKDLCNVINEFGYVEKLTDGRYNRLVYDRRRWYYAKMDGDMNIVEKSNTDVITMLSIDNAYEIKSTYNSPFGDLIILDEFISKHYKEDEFTDFCQIISTIFRLRRSGWIFLLTNTVDLYSPWFDELAIHNKVLSMKSGDSEVIESPLGTNLFLEWIKPNEVMTEKKRIGQRLYFGFTNKKLNAINGGGWEVKQYPHLPRADGDEKRELIYRDRYIKFYDNYLCLEVWKSDKIGMYLYVRPYYDVPTKTTYVLDTPKYVNHRFGFGYDKIDKFIWGLYSKYRVYYTTNEVGSIVEKFVDRIKSKHR